MIRASWQMSNSFLGCKRGVQLTANRMAAVSASRQVATKPEQVKLEKQPWHVFNPSGLAAVNTVGNVLALTAAASHDHMQLRMFAGGASVMVAAFNFLMPKPLKKHQWTAGGWGTAFAILHFANLARLMYEQTHQVQLTDEQDDIYEHGFMRFGVTPRQFSMLLQRHAQFIDFAPGECIVRQGQPVDRVMYVVHGTCTGRHFPCETNALEFHQDVFIGELEPKTWRAEYTGSYGRPKTGEQIDQEEETWLIDHASSVAKRIRGRNSSDIRTMLSEANGKVGRRTQLVVGAAWENQITAGPDGCRVLQWPLWSFAFGVGADAQLCDAMEKIDEMGLASKLVAGASNAALEEYRDILDGTLCDGRVDAKERHALSRYRTRHGIEDAAHSRMLREIGWTDAEFADGVQTHRWRWLRRLAWGCLWCHSLQQMSA